MTQRYFVETKQAFKAEELKLQKEFSRILKHDIGAVRLLQVYDVLGETVDTHQLYDELTQTITQDMELSNPHFAYEALEGQYNQTQEWAKVLIPNTKIKTSTLLIFEPDTDIKTLQNYYINPLEYKIKNLDINEFKEQTAMKPMKDFTGFTAMTLTQLQTFYTQEALAMELEDLIYIQDYFKKEARDPSEAELRVLDTYWSDHCRHTTFMSELDSITIEDFKLKEAIETSFKLYLDDKKELGREDKAISLMDVTAQNGRYAKKVLNDTIIEVSDEVNACSIKIDVDVDGVNEPWLLMFKNETHNHPTEIEPFGGASTCIGGAIRDPLSGRAYVYQAMRITGSGNILESFEDTHPDKLPQSIISTSAASGYSHYAKQIGISSSYVKEIYHDSYKAKRMELGAVVGAIKESDLIREAPLKGDVIVMLGGRTGRDGVGGATGSSDVQSLETAETNAAEVQKGNALEERKIIRLFRNPKISRMIKKSNDFGAGGVSVAIGELADGLDIDLSKVKTKYEGLNPVEIAISESQERMAVVLDPKHVERFIELSNQEGCEAVAVALVTDTNRLIIRDETMVHVDLDRDFLDSGGITQHVSARIVDTNKPNPLTETYELTKENILKDVSLLKNASQAGLAQYFDATDALIKPLLGETQLSPNIGSVQRIPLLKGTTDTVSVLTHGFIPSVSEYSPYIGGSLAVVESVSKTVALGGDYTKIYLSFQEYFNRLTRDDLWGNVLAALLGTYSTQRALGICAIGGKDSMSGTYEDLNVVDTLVSFACSPQKASNMISSELKSTQSKLYIIETPMDELGIVDFEALIKNYKAYHQLVKDQHVLSSSTSDDASALLAIIKMSFGNKIGLNIENDISLSQIKPGTIIFESKQDLKDFKCIGSTNESKTLTVNDTVLTIDELIQSSTAVLNSIYPSDDLKETMKVTETNTVCINPTSPQLTPNVLIPIFPGTTGEYDLIKAFNDEGVEATSFVYTGSNIDAFKDAINNSNIISLARGSINGDTPVLAGLLVEALKTCKDEIDSLIARGGIIMGFGNGFQALVRTGLIPHGTVTKPTLSFTMNENGRHVSLTHDVEKTSLNSFWLNGAPTIQSLYSSNTFGRLVGTGCAAYRYSSVNPNGSEDNVEALISDNGQIFGRMSQVDSITIKNALSHIRGDMNV